MNGSPSGTPNASQDAVSPNEDQLEFVLAQLERLQDAEDERRKTADAKLTSTISIMPLVVALATSGVFPLVQNIAALHEWKFVVLPLYAFAILCFLAGVFWALRAIWPARAKYSQSKIGSISMYRKPGMKRRDLLDELIVTERDALRVNQNVNARKLGEYMDSVIVSFCGLFCVVAVFILVCVGMALGQIHPIDCSTVPMVGTRAASVNNPSKSRNPVVKSPARVHTDKLRL